jgi:hypothetical protein
VLSMSTAVDPFLLKLYDRDSRDGVKAALRCCHITQQALGLIHAAYDFAKGFCPGLPAKRCSAGAPARP